MSGGAPRNFFFYGTLQSECSSVVARKILPKLNRVEEGRLNGRLFAIHAPHLTYPALLLDDKSRAQVRGTCYKIGPEFNAADMALLDAYEEYFPERPSNSEYLRHAHPVALKSGEKISAWVYVYNSPVPQNAEPIPSGDFRSYLNH